MSAEWCPSMRQKTAEDFSSFRPHLKRPFVPIQNKQCCRKRNLNGHNAVLIGICIQLRLQRYILQGKPSEWQHLLCSLVSSTILCCFGISFIWCCIVVCLCLFFSLDQPSLHWLSSPADTHQFDSLLLITPHSTLFVFTGC